MIVENIKLKDFYPNLKKNPILTTYCPDNFKEWSLKEKRKCILILPGGGYEFLSDRESEPVALRFVGHNIACFVLKYTIYPELEYPNPIVEAYAALAFIRKNAEKYHIDIDKISVLGFSAGGHLAATIACYHQNREYADYLGINLDEMKVNGCLLSYPVISSEFGHEGSITKVTQNRQDLKEKLSIDKHITKDFPKTFIWHTTFDTIVPVKNSLVLAEELEKCKVFFELHIYPMLDHGQSLCDRSVYTKETIDDDTILKMKHNTQWVENAIHFVKEYI